MKQFLGNNQLSVLKQNCKGEEKDFFKTMLKELQNTIDTMPKTYETG